MKNSSTTPFNTNVKLLITAGTVFTQIILEAQFFYRCNEIIYFNNYLIIRSPLEGTEM